MISLKVSRESQKVDYSSRASYEIELSAPGELSTEEYQRIKRAIGVIRSIFDIIINSENVRVQSLKKEEKK